MQKLQITRTDTCIGTLNLRYAVVAFALTVCNNCAAQIQQSWVAHYNNGMTNGTNQAVKMTVDSTGNIYVSGFSQNTTTNLGYVTIKYAPNGNQLWASRYDSTNYPSAQPSAMVIDASNNVIVTGNALTIKYDSNGNQLWIAPYAGTALADDAAGNAYVSGFSTNFNTVKLAPTGSNLWLTTYNDVGPTIGQSMLVDSNGNSYVSGADTFEYYGNGFTNYAAVGLLTIKYASNGSRIWLAKQPNGTPTGVQVAGTALDSASNVYITFNWTPGNLGAFVTSKYDSNGNLLWTSYPDHVTAAANGVALDGGANVLLVGQNAYQFNGAYSYYYTVFKLSAAGSPIWTNHFPQQPFGSSAATAISVDSANNSYVTGYSPGTNSGNDIVTIKYGPNGNQIWLQRYHGPGSGNDAGNAIAVDNNGNVYVTGYEATAAGGTEMVLIKYSPLTLQKRSDGSFLLHAQGSPGEIFDIQASANLINWLDLGTVIADTNGLMQFADTNASNFTSRYYITNPQ